jgi:hypothetical protein
MLGLILKYRNKRATLPQLEEEVVLSDYGKPLQG